MSNYYHWYYNTNLQDDRPGMICRKVVWENAVAPSEKQIAYHRALLEFLKEHGFPTGGYERPRDKTAYISSIRAMNEILRKNNLIDEFYGKPKEGGTGSEAKYNFPVLHVGSAYLSFNRAFSELFPATHVRFRASTDLLVLCPVPAGSGAYSLSPSRSGALTCRTPVCVDRLKLKRGSYRVYRAGDSFAIRRNERINEGDAG